MSTIKQSKAEQVELNQRAASQAGRADDARRARLILLLEGRFAANSPAAMRSSTA